MNIKDAIAMFLGTSDRGLDRPWVRGGSLYATNEHILIEIWGIPEETIGVPLEPWGDRQGTEPLINKKVFWDVKHWEPFNPSLIEATLSGAPGPLFRSVPEYETCDYCNGFGEIKDMEGPDYSCPDCDGKGMVRNEVFGEKVPVITPIAFHGRHYNYHYLKTIKEAMEAFGGTWEIAQGALSTYLCSTLPTIVRNDSGTVRIAIMECRP